MLQLNLTSIDLAGQYHQDLNFWQIQHRIDALINRYLSVEHLRDRLEDLPVQFRTPQTRPWQPIDWQAIDRQQVVGIDLDVFLAILKGAIDTEAPIRQYTQTSRLYLEQLHPQMARFVGGSVDEHGSLIEPGLWEKEERQHTPALMKVYTQLTGEKITPTQRSVRSYQSSDNPRNDLYRHGLHRIATEYGATCLYLWLMAHTTGPLQVVLEELVRDEINHMTKFWGFGVWAFPESSLPHIGLTLLQTMQGRLTYSQNRSSLVGTLHRMTNVLAWQSWSWSNRATFIFTCTRVLHRLYGWSRSLRAAELQKLFGKDEEERRKDERGREIFEG
ncbi:ferritin-like domain-containing protein [Trichocoleus sp. FACHB-262]|nr:ferritin-like domain-containing protein [Trichocoleus sp. FACHB-262]